MFKALRLFATGVGYCVLLFWVLGSLDFIDFEIRAVPVSGTKGGDK
jgi:cell division septal protein FtsQ